MRESRLPPHPQSRAPASRQCRPSFFHPVPCPPFQPRWSERLPWILASHRTLSSQDTAWASKAGRRRLTARRLLLLAVPIRARVSLPRPLSPHLCDGITQSPGADRTPRGLGGPGGDPGPAALPGISESPGRLGHLRDASESQRRTRWRFEHFNKSYLQCCCRKKIPA